MGVVVLVMVSFEKSSGAGSAHNRDVLNNLREETWVCLADRRMLRDRNRRAAAIFV